VFVTTDRFPAVADPLRTLGVEVDESIADVVTRDGQGRVFWDRAPIDLFFAYDPFHHAAERRHRVVPFAGTTIPILGPEHLAVCKVVFNRPKDWVDIDAMLATREPLDTAEILRWVGRIAGDADPRFERIAALLTKA
jgi:hypothetical protein